MNRHALSVYFRSENFRREDTSTDVTSILLNEKLPKAEQTETPMKKMRKEPKSESSPAAGTSTGENLPSVRKNSPDRRQPISRRLPVDATKKGAKLSEGDQNASVKNREALKELYSRYNLKSKDGSYIRKDTFNKTAAPAGNGIPNPTIRLSEKRHKNSRNRSNDDSN